MKKIITIFIVLVAMISGLFVWYQLVIKPTHEKIDVNGVLDVRILGEAIQNADGWTHAEKKQTEQIVKWFNSANYIGKVDKTVPAKSNGSAIVIEMKPREKLGNLITNRGEIIIIINSENGFEVRRENNVNYQAKQDQLKEYLIELEQPK